MNQIRTLILLGTLLLIITSTHAATSYRITGNKKPVEITPTNDLVVLRWRLESKTTFAGYKSAMVKLDTRPYLKEVKEYSATKAGEDWFEKPQRKRQKDPERQLAKREKYIWHLNIYFMDNHTGNVRDSDDIYIETTTSAKPRSRVQRELAKRPNTLPNFNRGPLHELRLIEKPLPKGVLVYSESVRSSGRKAPNKGRFQTDVIIVGKPK